MQDATADTPPLPDLSAWIGRSESSEDRIDLNRVSLLAATLDLDGEARRARDLVEGGPLPPLWHWLGFLPAAPMSGLGPDGHPKRGGFLPPVPLERRMWAGGRLAFRDTIRIGEALHRRSEILSVAEKSGGAGRMVFVTVRHVLSSARGVAIEEEHDIVYVAMPDRFVPPAPVPAPTEIAWEEPVAIGPVLLFRFSALTFNGHRIHYDLAYAREVERYPGLVVHGPLQAMLMMEAACRQRGAWPVRYGFRGTRPLFHTDTLRVVGTPPRDDAQSLATVNGEGLVCMKATIDWSG